MAEAKTFDEYGDESVMRALLVAHISMVDLLRGSHTQTQRRTAENKRDDLRAEVLRRMSAAMEE